MTTEASRALKQIDNIYPDLLAGKVAKKDIGELIKRIQGEASNLSGKGMQQASDDLLMMKDIIENSIEDAAGEGTKAAFKAARQQWGHLRVLEKGSVLTRGNINPRSLNSALKQEYGATFKRGLREGDDLFDAARITEQMADIVGNSGTATRMHMADMIAHPIEKGLMGIPQRKAFKGYLESGNEAYSDLLGGYRGNQVIEAAGRPAARGAVGIMNQP